MIVPVPYVDGKLLDVHAPTVAGPAPVVLLWHGSGVDERDVLAPLAAEVAAHGVMVLVPDWQSDDLVAGSGQLVASIGFARDRSGEFGGDPTSVVLAGWSLGANAAVFTACHPLLVGGWRPAGVVGLAGSYDGSPFGIDPDGWEPGGPVRRTVLLHGTADPVVPVRRSEEGARALARLGWEVDLETVDTDHAGIVGSEYDPWRRRCVVTEDPARLAVRSEVAARIAAVALG